MRDKKHSIRYRSSRAAISAAVAFVSILVIASVGAGAFFVATNSPAATSGQTLSTSSGSTSITSTSPTTTTTTSIFSTSLSTTTEYEHAVVTFGNGGNGPSGMLVPANTLVWVNFVYPESISNYISGEFNFYVFADDSNINLTLGLYDSNHDRLTSI